MSKEKIDIYNSHKELTHRTIYRYDPLQKGEYLLGVQLILFNIKNQILITKRSPLKKLNPNLWECNGGGVLSGETSIDGLIREIHEELNLQLSPSNLILYKTIKKENHFKDIYISQINTLDVPLKFNDQEVVDAKWVDISKYQDLQKRKLITPNNDFNKTDYYTCLKIIQKIN